MSSWLRIGRRADRTRKGGIRDLKIRNGLREVRTRLQQRETSFRDFELAREPLLVAQHGQVVHALRLIDGALPRLNRGARAIALTARTLVFDLHVFTKL